MLQIDERTNLLVRVAVVNENRPLLQKVPVAFKNQVYRRVEKWMAGADELSQRLAR
jgi:hypothetical protein